jgi:hypothetical protein
MGGGGFMQHASDTNRKDRSQKAARRETFNGNYSDKTNLGEKHSTKLDFSHLTQEQITKERNRIQQVFFKRRKKNLAVIIVVLSILVISAVWLYYLFI